MAAWWVHIKTYCTFSSADIVLIYRPIDAFLEYSSSDSNSGRKFCFPVLKNNYLGKRKMHVVQYQLFDLSRRKDSKIKTIFRRKTRNECFRIIERLHVPRSKIYFFARGELAVAVLSAARNHRGW